MTSVRQGIRLGVDPGSVRVGIARSDESGVLAVPLRTLARDDDTVSTIAAMVGEWEAFEIVVGYPLTLAGDARRAAAAAEDLARAIAAAVRETPVRLVDERLTTATSKRVMRSVGRSERHAREVLDQAAAVVILQNALDTERATGCPPGRLVGGGRVRSTTDEEMK